MSGSPPDPWRIEQGRARHRCRAAWEASFRRKDPVRPAPFAPGTARQVVRIGRTRCLRPRCGKPGADSSIRIRFHISCSDLPDLARWLLSADHSLLPAEGRPSWHRQRENSARWRCLAPVIMALVRRGLVRYPRPRNRDEWDGMLVSFGPEMARLFDPGGTVHPRVSGAKLTWLGFLFLALLIAMGIGAGTRRWRRCPCGSSLHRDRQLGREEPWGPSGTKGCALGTDYAPSLSHSWPGSSYILFGCCSVAEPRLVKERQLNRAPKTLGVRHGSR